MWNVIGVCQINEVQIIESITHDKAREYKKEGLPDIPRKRNRNFLPSPNPQECQLQFHENA